MTRMTGDVDTIRHFIAWVIYISFENASIFIFAVAIMLQDSFIFSGTIMDNIRYSKLDATDEEVIEAARAVQAHEFIMSMKDGYLTEVNERGSRLSAGQRQLISFARALLADPRILILDDERNKGGS